MHEFEMEAIGVIVEALQAEHPYLSQMVVGPVVDFIHEVSLFVVLTSLPKVVGA